MKRFLKSWTLAAILMAALASVLAPRAAAQTGSISGTILDVSGKPWAEVGIRSVSDQGAKQETKTDSAGKFSVPNLRAGIYTVFIIFPPPNDKQAPYEVKCRVQSGEDAKVDVNFQEVVAKQGAAAQEQVKKAEEAKSKLEGLKTHFTAGNALIDQEKQAKVDLQKANRPADAIEPLRKATELDPKSAQAWYLLGASLLMKMTTKKVGDREEVQLAPGTVEAYQKAEELDPNGPWGQQAKQGLTDLKALGAGIETKVNVKKKKS